MTLRRLPLLAALVLLLAGCATSSPSGDGDTIVAAEPAPEPAPSAAPEPEPEPEPTPAPGPSGSTPAGEVAVPANPVITDEAGEVDLGSLGETLSGGGTGVTPLPFELPSSVQLLAPVEGEVGSNETMWLHTLVDGADPVAVCSEVARIILEAGYAAVLAADCGSARPMGMYVDGTRRISLVLDPTGLTIDGRPEPVLTVGVAPL